ncbi:MAG: hypothetical protein QOI67_1735 [Gaiellaceae bacterium]|nr:hypothetical protein [Gaiellaceae bacterium]
MHDFERIGELSHPEGVSPRRVSIHLSEADGVESGAKDRELDLAVVIERAKTSAGRWAAEAARIRDSLAADGVAFVRPAAAGSRRRIGTALRAAGLVVTPLAYLPSFDAQSHVLRQDGVALRFALAELASLGHRRAAATRALAAVSTRAAWSLVPHDVALVARRPGARPLFAWLFDAASVRADHGSVVVSSDRRLDDATLILRVLEGDRPVAVAKAGVDGASGRRIRADHEHAELLRKDASSAGAVVPHTLAFEDRARTVTLCRSALPGVVAARILGAAPARLPELTEHLAQWLRSWAATTAEQRPLEPILRRDLLQPARELSPLLANGDEYVAGLEALCSRVDGLPSVATHNDLTMWNVVVPDEHDALGIVDWEAARVDGLPLVDLYYSFVDASAATNRYDDRVASWRACFEPSGSHVGTARRLEESIRRDLRLSNDAAAACFHACWVHHAANERRQLAGSRGPFLAIVDHLSRRDDVSVWGGR